MSDIDALHKLIEIREDRIAEAKDIMRKLLGIIPTPSCDMFHHKKKDRHAPLENCPCVERVMIDIEKARMFIYKS